MAEETNNVSFLFVEGSGFLEQKIMSVLADASKATSETEVGE